MDYEDIITDDAMQEGGFGTVPDDDYESDYVNDYDNDDGDEEDGFDDELQDDFSGEDDYGGGEYDILDDNEEEDDDNDEDEDEDDDDQESEEEDEDDESDKSDEDKEDENENDSEDKEETNNDDSKDGKDGKNKNYIPGRLGIDFIKDYWEDLKKHARNIADMINNVVKNALSAPTFAIIRLADDPTGKALSFLTGPFAEILPIKSLIDGALMKIPQLQMAMFGAKKLIDGLKAKGKA